MISTLTVTVPADDRLLTALATIKTELQITGSAFDDYLSDLIGQASDAINSFCRRPEGFGRETVTETFRLDSAADCLILARDIGATVTQVVEDGTTLDAADYLLDGSLLRRLDDDAVTDWTARKVVVSYSAGYVLPSEVSPTLPGDLERCCIDLVARAHNARGRDPALRSERVLDVIAQSWETGGGSGFKGGMPNDVADRLAFYSRPVA